MANHQVNYNESAIAVVCHINMDGVLRIGRMVIVNGDACTVQHIKQSKTSNNSR